jgi:hypothetical protein
MAEITDQLFLLTNHNKIIEDVKKVKERIINTDTKSLIKKDFPKSFFSKFAPGIERIKEKMKKLDHAELSTIPPKILINIKEIADQILKNFERMREYDINFNNPEKDNRNDLINNLLQLDENLYKEISYIFAYSHIEKVEIADLMEDLRLSNEEASHILMDMRRKEAEQTVDKHAKNFDDASKEYNVKSWIWLAVTALISGLTIWFAFNSYEIFNNMFNIQEEVTTAKVIQLGVTKLMIFSILYFGIIWAGKIYKSQQHNYIINCHRRNALNTFKTFVDGTENPEIKDAVLLEATKSIFSPLHSGFSSKDSDKITSPAVIEIFKNFFNK